MDITEFNVRVETNRGKHIRNRLNTMNYFIEVTCEIDDYHIIDNNGMKLLIMHQRVLKSYAS